MRSVRFGINLLEHQDELEAKHAEESSKFFKELRAEMRRSGVVCKRFSQIQAFCFQAFRLALHLPWIHAI